MEQYSQAVYKYKKCKALVESDHKNYLYAVGSKDDSFWTLFGNGTIWLVKI